MNYTGVAPDGRPFVLYPVTVQGPGFIGDALAIDFPGDAGFFARLAEASNMPDTPEWRETLRRLLAERAKR